MIFYMPKLTEPVPWIFAISGCAFPFAHVVPNRDISVCPKLLKSIKIGGIPAKTILHSFFGGRVT